MAMTCPMNGCHSEGMCWHKAMMVMMLIVIAIAAYFMLK